jgi:sorting nexin-29
MEKYYEYDKDLFIIFVNFKQAYDSINRQQLWTALRNFEIPEKLVRMIEICNSYTYCRVRYQGELSLQFEVQSGLKQSDAMSPVLFNLALEQVMRDMSVCHEMELNGKNVMLAYAGDIVILGDKESDIVKAAEKLIEASNRMNLTINEEKTKYLIMTRRSVDKTALKVGPYSFEQVDEFKYLGVNINTKNNMHKEI